jgi:peptidoglycan/xylan/chitin deacetylase (PgdA/CDA1 family)
MLLLGIYTAVSLLQFPSQVQGCMPESHNPMRKRWLQEDKRHQLIKRAGCGPTAGGASCPPGQCCSSAGLCGTGGAFCTAPDCLYQYGPACDANQVPPGASTANIPRPLFGSVPYGVVIQHCTVPGKVALTFDDGPYLYTSQILDTLKAANITATFCVTGNNGGKGQIEQGYPAIIERTVAEGHHLVSHSWSHQDLTQASPQALLAQIVNNEIALNDILGFVPTYYRPPYGFTNGQVISQLQQLGYHILNWDLDTLDWQGDYVKAKQNFNGPLSAGSPKSSSFIVLSHDIHQQTVTDLVPYMIQRVQALGYSFASVGECLGDPSANWYRDGVTGQPVSQIKLQAVAKAVGLSSTTTSTTISTSTTTSTITSTISSTASSTISSSSVVSSSSAIKSSSMSSLISSITSSVNFGGSLPTTAASNVTSTSSKTSSASSTSITAPTMARSWAHQSELSILLPMLLFLVNIIYT